MIKHLILLVVIFPAILVISILMYCTNPVIEKKEPEPFSRPGFFIITDVEYCAVVTRGPDGLVTESFYEDTDLDGCINWLRDHYHKESLE